MKGILFICGCLEVSKDGVGDYCRRLGEELKIRGVKVYSAAWRDQYVPSQIYEETDHIRFSPALPESEKIQRLNLWLKDKPVSDVSLQWVGYAFHPKGFPWRFIRSLKILKDLIPNRHLMVHEIWIGVEPDLPLKQKLIGKFQKVIFTKMIRTWEPQIIHTQAPLYQDLLRSSGIESRLLPLFGNIPIVEVSDTKTPPRNNISLVAFGTVPEEVDYEPFFRQIASIETDMDLRFHFIFIGRNGNGLNGFIEQASRFFKSEAFLILGELTAAEISRKLQDCDYGLAFARPHLVCKSGTAVAFEEHGLPILCTRKGEIPPVLKAPPYFRVPVIELSAIQANLFAPTISKRAMGSKLETVCDQFLNDLRIPEGAMESDIK